MKKIGLILFFVILSSSVKSEGITYFRDAFLSISNEASANAFLNTSATAKSLNELTTINSYKAVCKMMMAQYVFNPFTKLSWFNKGKKQLEACIAKNKNIENIYLRIMVQIKAPFFLEYNSEINADLIFIQNNLEKSTIPHKTKVFILKKLIDTGEANELNNLAKKYGVI